MAILRIAFPILLLLSVADAAGMECSQTLYFKNEPQTDVFGVLMRSWEFTDGNWLMSGYEPRSTNYALVPWARDDNSPEIRQPKDMYMGLDWFTAWGGTGDEKSDYIRVHFQRKARTYLILHGSGNDGETPSLPGWKPVGWVRRPPDAPKAKMAFGVDEMTYSFSMGSTGFVFMKEGYEVMIGTKDYNKKYARHIGTNGYWSVLVAEAGGSPSQRPRGDVKGGKAALPGKLCPSWLHDKWVVKGFDDNDPDTNNKLYRTYHPLWDPCFFCSYGHEHGSNAPLLMDYWPRYGYMAEKNGNEDESHEGFKDYVLYVPPWKVYYGVHAHLSKARRFTERFHTNVVVVKHRSKLSEKLVDLRYKADYGRLAALNDDGKVVTLTKEGQKTLKETDYHIRRQVQVETVQQTIKYEEWTVRPPCSKTTEWRPPEVLIKDPRTGLKYLRFRENEIVKLRGVSLNREFRARDWMIANKYCDFNPPDNTGVFYTNSTGRGLRSGPGPDNAYQYIKPGFTMKVTGWFETRDTWLGLYKDKEAGFMRNIMYGIVSDMN